MKAPNPLNQAGLITMGDLIGLTNKKTKKDERPENSIALRVISLLMAIILITAAATYVDTPNVVTFLYIWGSVCGSYISYAFRNNKPAILSIFPLIGTFIVCGIFTYELFTQFMFGKFDPLGPFIHVLTGLQALHFFDMKTRSDVSISIMIGLSVLCCVAAAGNGPLFGVYVAIYLFLGSIFLYLECVSRSKDVGPSRPLGEARPGSQSQAAPPRLQRQPSGNVIFPVMSLPLLTVLVFFGMPRVDSIIDATLASFMRAKIPISATSSTGRPGAGRGGQGGSQSSGGGQGGTAGGSGKTGEAGGGGSKDGRGTGADASDVAAAQSGPGALGKGGKDKGDGKGGKGGKGKSDGLPGSGNSDGSGTGSSNLTVGLDAEAANETMSLDRPAGKDELLLRVSSQRESCIRRIAFDTFDGKTWRRKQPRKLTAHIATAGQGVTVSDLPAFELSSDCPTVEVTMDVRVESDIHGVLPSVWVPSFVSSTIKSFFVDKDGTIIARQVLRKGTLYKIVAYIPVYDFTTLRAVSDKKPADDAYLQLPEGFSKPVSDLAVKTAGEGNAFVKAERICQFLRDNFKYVDTETKLPEGADYVENFLLKTKQGDCKHFATSFVVMCRAAGAEARCVGGFQPGTLNKESGFREIHMRDAHAWAEVYLPNWGWIAFDATPKGLMPLHEQENFLSSMVKHGLGGFGTSIQSKKKHMPGMAQNDPRKFDPKDDKKKLDFWEKLDPRELLSNLPWKAFAVGLTLLTMAAMAWHYLSTRKKAGEIAETHDISRRSTQLYMEMLKDLQRYKIARNPAETPDEVLRRLEASFDKPAVDAVPLPPELPRLVSSFMNVYCMDRFGNRDRTQELESICSNIHTLVTSK